MLKIFQKRLKIDKILGKKCKNVTELHEKLSEFNIKYEITVTKSHTTWYLLTSEGVNYACRLLEDNKNCVYLTR